MQEENMNSIIRRTKLAAILGLSMLVFGCASTQKLTDADRAKLNSVKINATVDKGQLFILAPGGGVGLLFGPIGAAVASSSIENTQKAFTDFLDKNSLSVDKIVREEIEKTLRESGKVAITTPGDATTPVMTITVPQYGFGVTNLLGSSVVPVLNIKCEIVDSSGKVIWSSSDRMGPSIANPMPSVTWAQMHDDPKLIEEQWRKAANYLGKKIINEL
jgi:hypothetical protein